MNKPKCPVCGATDLMFLENYMVCVSRRVIDLFDDELQIEPEYSQTTVGRAGCGDYPRFGCRACGNTFDIPKGFVLHFLME